MTRKKLLIVSAVCFVSLACCAQTDNSSGVEGRITGLVLTEDGQPAVGATACISMRSGNNNSITCRDRADNEGRFTIEKVTPGKYQVFAINEAEGYSIENQSPGEDVTVSADHLWPEMTIRLRSKGGILIGSVVDKATGRGIRAQVQYIAIDRDGGGGSKLFDGNFVTVIPANCDVLVVVMAKGYRGWVYGDGSNSARPVLRLAPGERKVLHIELERSAESPARPDSASTPLSFGKIAQTDDEDKLPSAGADNGWCFSATTSH